MLSRENQTKPQSNKGRKKPLREIADFLFGFDVFVSYARADATQYAVALVTELESRNYRCFLDTKEPLVGDKLSKALKKALHKSRSLLFIATPASLSSPYTREEVLLFDKTDKILVPINIGHSLTKKDTDQRLMEVLHSRIWSEEPSNSLTNSPSASVINDLISRFQYRTTQTLIRQLLIFLILLFASLTILAGTLAFREKNAREQESLARMLAEKRLAQTKRAKQAVDGLLASNLAMQPGREHSALLSGLESALPSIVNGRIPPTESVVGIRTAIERGRIVYTFAGHSSEINDLQFSKDGKIVLSASSDQTVKTWDAYSGKINMELQHDGKVWSAFFTNDDQFIITSGPKDGTKIWDRVTGQQKYAFQGLVIFDQLGPVSPDSASLLTAADGGHVRLYDLKTGILLNDFLHPRYVNTAGFSPDGLLIVTACDDGKVRLWSVDDYKIVTELHSKQNVFSAARFLDNKHVLGLAGFDSSYTPVVWQLDSGKQIETPSYLINSIDAITVDDEGNSMALADWSHSVAVWDKSNLQERSHQFGISGREILALSYSPGNNVIAAVGQDGFVALLWAHDLEIFNNLPGNHGDVNTVSFSPDGTRIAVGNEHGLIKIYNLFIKPMKETFRTECSAPSVVSFSKDMKTIIVGCDDGSLNKFTITRPQDLIKINTDNKGEILDIFSNDDNSFDIITSQGLLLRLNGAKLERIGNFNETLSRVFRSSDSEYWIILAKCGKISKVQKNFKIAHNIGKIVIDSLVEISVSSNCKKLVCVLKNGTIASWKADSKFKYNDTQNIKPKDALISPNLRSFLVKDSAGELFFYDSSDISNIKKLWQKKTEDLLGPNLLTFSQDGLTFVTDGTPWGVRVWSAESGELIGEERGDSGMVRFSRYSNDMSLIAMLGSNREVTLVPSYTIGSAMLACFLVELGNAGTDKPELCLHIPNGKLHREIFVSAEPNQRVRLPF